jgi:hypothetical protein
MSRVNVERYRRSLDAWNRGALEEWLEDITPGWEFVSSGVFPGLDPIYRGREGALKLWDAMRGPWDNQGFRFKIERIEDLRETVLALATIRARGETSGADVTLMWASSSPTEAATSRRGTTRAGTKPSKPWGCGSRRCRGRTWRSSRENVEPGVRGRFVAVSAMLD